MIDWNKMNTTKEEMISMSNIVKMANKEYSLRAGEPLDIMARVMDMEACHNTCPLNLEGLETAELSDLLHDVLGIASHLNRETGELEGCFVPRYAMN